MNKIGLFVQKERSIRIETEIDPQKPKVFLTKCKKFKVGRLLFPLK